MNRKVRVFDLSPFPSKNQGALDDVTQLTNISGPGVTHESLFDVFRKRRAWKAEGFADNLIEMLHEQRDVIDALTQWRKL